MTYWTQLVTITMPEWGLWLVILLAVLTCVHQALNVRQTRLLWELFEMNRQQEFTFVHKPAELDEDTVLRVLQQAGKIQRTAPIGEPRG